MAEIRSVKEILRQAAAQRQAQAEAQLAQEREKAEQVRLVALEGAFMEVYNTATGTPADALKGKVGTRVYIQDPTDGGELVLEVIKVYEKKALKVIATFMSRFEGAQWYMPLWMVLGDFSLERYTPREEFFYELRRLLRDVWVDDIATITGAPAAPKGSLIAPQIGVAVPTPRTDNNPLPMDPKQKEAKPTARVLTWQRIEGCVGSWEHGKDHFDGLASGVAWLRQTTVAGARKFVLTGVTGAHPLRSMWEKVDGAEVIIDIAEVFPKGPVATATDANDTTMRAARREFARYLRERYDDLKALDPASAVMVSTESFGEVKRESA